MANQGRGGGQPQTGKGAAAGERGGNRGGQQKPERSGSGPKSGHQSHGADPRRGEPG